MDEQIKVITYFNAEDGILGEACNNSPSRTEIRDVVWRDGEAWESEVHKVVFCLIVLKNGATVIGTNKEGSRSLAYEDAARQL